MATKKEILNNRQDWKIENLFWEHQIKGWWYVRATNRHTNEEVEFNVTSSYLRKCTNYAPLYTLTN